MYSLKSSTKWQFEKEVMIIAMPYLDWLDNDEFPSNLEDECNCIDHCIQNDYTRCEKNHGYKYQFSKETEYGEVYEIRISRTRFKELKHQGYKAFYEYKITCTYKNKDRITVGIWYMENYNHETSLPKIASRHVSTSKVYNSKKRRCVLQ